MRYKLLLRSRCPVHALLTSTVVAAAVALAGCTSDGTPALSENASITSFVRDLFGSKSEDQPPVAHSEAPVKPSAPKAKSATSKPKHPAVAAAGAHPAKLAKSKTATEVPKASPKREAGAEPQNPSESSTPHSLSGAAPTLPTGSFENRVGSPR